MTMDEIRWSKAFAEEIINAEFIYSDELLTKSHTYATDKASDEFRENFSHAYRFIYAAKIALENGLTDLSIQLMNDARWASQGTMSEVLDKTELYG